MACIGLLLFNGYNRAFRPYLYDKSNYYYKAYHYKVKKIKPQKKIVKDIEIEVLRFGKDDFPDNLSTYKDSPLYWQRNWSEKAFFAYHFYK